MSNLQSLDMIIAGVGGQGNILASQIIAEAAINEGWHIGIGETYGASQRGGSVMSHLRMFKNGAKGPLVPKGACELVVGFEPLETLRVLLEYGNSETKVIFNSTPIYPIGVSAGAMKYPPIEDIYQRLDELCAGTIRVDATSIVLEWEQPQVLNIVMVGALAGSGLLPIKKESLIKQIEATFRGKAAKLNIDAFDAGIKSARKA